MIKDNLKSILDRLPSGVTLVAVSKFHPVDSIMEAYNAGQRTFGESRPQEFEKKVPQLPSDIRWHFIGHLQTNKLKMVLPYVSMVESVDTVHLLDEIEKWGRANSKVTDVLLEMHLGAEDTKQGLYEEEILDLLFRADSYKYVRFRGLMGMASHTDDMSIVRADFERIEDYMAYLKDLFPEYEDFDQLSIGMSDDYPIAIECGATIVRVGTAIFGPRQY